MLCENNSKFEFEKITTDNIKKKEKIQHHVLRRVSNLTNEGSVRQKRGRYLFFNRARWYVT